MKLVERYVYAVTENMPEDMRHDVAEELRSNIEDMLPDSPTDEDIREVLEKMGNPKKLANEYYPKKRYLIGPDLYDSYFSVLKLVIGIAVPVIIGISMLSWFLEGPENSNYVKLFADLLSSAIFGAFQAAVWVTFGFAVVERSGISSGQLPFAKKKWTLDDLPAEPISQKKKISRGETIFSVFCTIFFTMLIYFKPQLIAIYIKDNSTMQSFPLFSTQQLRLYIPFIFVLAVTQLGIVITKFIQRKWSIPLAAANAIQNSAVSILVLVMINDRLLFHNDFFLKMAQILKVQASQLTDGWSWGMTVFGVVFVLICLWDSISSFFKAKG